MYVHFALSHAYLCIEAQSIVTHIYVWIHAIFHALSHTYLPQYAIGIVIIGTVITIQLTFLDSWPEIDDAERILLIFFRKHDVLRLQIAVHVSIISSNAWAHLSGTFASMMFLSYKVQISMSADMCTQYQRMHGHICKAHQILLHKHDVLGLQRAIFQCQLICAHMCTPKYEYA